MDFRLDTQDLEPDRRVDTWTREMRRLCSPMSTEMLGTTPFRARVEACELGPVGLRHIDVDPYRGRQTRSTLAAVRHERYIFTVATAGRFRMSQFGRDVVLDAGRGVLHSTMETGEYEHADRAGALIAVLPATLLRDRISVPEDFCALSLDDSNATFRVLRDLLLTTRANAAALAAHERDVMSSCLVDLVAASLARPAEAPHSGSAVQQGRLYRIKSYADARLGDMDLTPEVVAGANHISTRHLHSLFRLEGRSFGAWLQQRRLERARTALASNGQAGATIAAIAHRHGFRSAAHFSQAFRHRFGMTPRDWRRAAGRDDR